MIFFFKAKNTDIYAVKTRNVFNQLTITKLTWLFGGALPVDESRLEGGYIGPRKEMITPWSTNAVEISQNMGISHIERIEVFQSANHSDHYDRMLQAYYEKLDQQIFTINRIPEPIKQINDIRAYNETEGLALSNEEIDYLESLSGKIGRKLTDSEIFGFSQVNSEHCRHKIFNGTFIVDGITKDLSLFQLIKRTTNVHPNRVVSAYKDNCAFLQGPEVLQFAPITQDKPDYYILRPIETVISLKAETHNFPTTVEPFNGAATGTGGEIRDRISGGKGALPLAGTAIYMTSYPRLNGGRQWEKAIPERIWRYQTPGQILIKASNGASDFGNKFGQPLICGSLLTFEHSENGKFWAFDKVIMLAGGVGYANKLHSIKETPHSGDKVVLLGGDNYRIGMGGGAVSSVATGEYDNAIELNAVQRSNPEMQKRVFNTIRALAESENNPIVSIHDHGAGGHLNCFSELLESTGGVIEINNLPIGDPTLSDKEIIGNESQERIGIVLKEKDVNLVSRIADRERSPHYSVGEATGDHQFTFRKSDKKPIDLRVEDFFGNPPKTIMNDRMVDMHFVQADFQPEQIAKYVADVLQLEGVACKDWLTNKVDRSVTGLIAKQQTCGSVQLPLNNLAITALDYSGYKGIATALGHAPAAGIIDAAKGSVLSIAEALTNIVWAPIEGGLRGISLSANWMWPCRQEGEDARLYAAVTAASDFAVALGINIPTGKDSLSMTQKYKDGSVVYSPGTVIISAAGEVTDFRKTVEPVLQNNEDALILYIDFSSSPLVTGGSSLAQSVNTLGNEAPTVDDPSYFVKAFETIQQLITDGKILAGHDISSGGLIVTLLEMCFASSDNGMEINLNDIPEKNLINLLFSENPGIIIQVEKDVCETLTDKGLLFYKIGRYVKSSRIDLVKNEYALSFSVPEMRDIWFKTSYLLDRDQSGHSLAEKRFVNYKNQPLRFVFNSAFTGKLAQYGADRVRRNASGIKAAIIREKGVNGDREMAYMMYLAGFDVKDVHMTDLISGREKLNDINLIVFVGGFSNSDVLGSAKGWAGAFLYNDEARKTLDRFDERSDTLSLGVCNGCQLMAELNLITRDDAGKPRMFRNASNKFESAFLTVDIPQNRSVMLHSMAGSRLGIWVAHGEGRFSLANPEADYHIAMKYSYSEYPGNPNGCDYDVAGICSDDGRHLAIMPHFERSIFPWNWAYYPKDRKEDEVSPWIEAFANAREWIEAWRRRLHDFNVSR
ncbi:MAG TPA: phosphoribosylformylglycinamidine synthase [Bacteroidales bacterium]|jgi:phosphoribosylformylglycinamidine synthase|nr:phosphoribosylformylglycinamidine synthase [Bacteroidales bacterium]